MYGLSQARVHGKSGGIFYDNCDVTKLVTLVISLLAVLSAFRH